MKIYVDTPFKDEYKKLLVTSAPDDTFIFKEDLASSKEQEDMLFKADILLGNPKPVELVAKATNLKWIQLYSTGFEYYRNIKIPAVITNMQDYYSQPCAETAVGGIMALYRGMDLFGVLKDKKAWVGYTLRANLQLLMNKKVIILGFGNIGRRVNKILSGFDCEIKIYARTAPEASIRTAKELEEAVKWADIVIGCLPGTAETKGFYTTTMIQNMKPGSVFCNVGRGNLVQDEMALVDALKTGKIGGAVLDVTEEEPIPEGHPLWDCPNTILSQHSGGGNITEYEGIANFFLENLQRFKKNETLLNQVDFNRGY